MNVSLLRAAGALALLGGGATFVACSENNGDTVVPQQATQEGMAERSPEGGGGEPTVLEIQANEYSFTPDFLEAVTLSGVTIELFNAGSEEHSIAFYTDQARSDPVTDGESDPVPPGETITFDLPIDQPGTYYFHCELHPDRMDGELAVGPAGSGQDRDGNSDGTPSGEGSGGDGEDEESPNNDESGGTGNANPSR